MTAAVVVLNPRAAGGRAAALRGPIEQWLRSEAPHASLLASRSIDEAQAHLRSMPVASRVVLVGGDGTLHHLLAPALECGHTLGLVPLGSGNDTARAVGLFPMKWPDALGHALNAPGRPIDVGELSAEGRRVPFISSLCAGFDASICSRVVVAPRCLCGLPRYLWGTLGELAGLRRWRVRITLDGEIRHCGDVLFASTCNTPTFGSGMPAVPGARIDDGRLDLLLAGEFGRVGALRMLPRLLAGTHLRDARVSTSSYRSLQIMSDTPIPLAADGEPLSAVCSFRIDVRPAALPFVVGPLAPAFGDAAAIRETADTVRG